MGWTEEGEFVGTYAYASPEQLRGKPLTRRSDIYNLGVLFYRMFTGKLPFYGDGVYDIARQHVEVRPTPPIERASALPNELSELIMQMLEKVPKRRPRGMVTLVEALDKIIGDSEVPSLLPDLAAPNDRLVGRAAQLVKAQEFLATPEPGSMLAVVGGRGCGRRGFSRRVREMATTLKWRTNSASFRRDYPPLQTLADLFRQLGNELDTGLDPAIQTMMVALESTREWTAEELAKETRPLVRMLSSHTGVLLLRNVHLADLEASLNQ